MSVVVTSILVIGAARTLCLKVLQRSSGSAHRRANMGQNASRIDAPWPAMHRAQMFGGELPLRF
jgi:hypothetical protein